MAVQNLSLECAQASDALRYACSAALAAPPDWITLGLQIASAIISLAGFVVAWRIFREAQAIRAAQWVSNQNAGWNDFNSAIMAHNGEYQAVREIFGREGEELGLNEKQLRLLFMKMNLLEADFRAAASGKFSDKIGGHHVVTVLKQVAPAEQDGLIRFMADAGYDHTFIRFAWFAFKHGDKLTGERVHRVATLALNGKRNRGARNRLAEDLGLPPASVNELCGLAPLKVRPAPRSPRARPRTS